MRPAPGILAVFVRAIAIAAAAVVVGVGVRYAAIGGMLSMTLIHPVAIGVGTILCIVCGHQASQAGGIPKGLLYALSGAFSLWFDLFIAVTTYFDVWQASPNPPPEAFTDGAQLVGVVIGGWLPGLAVFGLTLIAFWVRKNVKTPPTQA